MSHQPATSRLEYLTNASHLLAPSAPETSAYLSRCCDVLAARSDAIPSEVERQQVCSACGAVMIPGISGSLSIKARQPTNTKQKPLRGNKSRGLGISKVYTCTRCFRYTEIFLEPPEKIDRAGARLLQLQRDRRSEATRNSAKIASERGLDAPRVLATTSAASKKRAKARKAGLQALLAQGSSGGGLAGRTLTLSDFTKKR